MYLSDRDIRDLLPQLQFSSDDRTDEFNAQEQIQPCSIDLRLDYVFWIQIRGSILDLRSSKLMELNPRRNWKKVFLNDGESIRLKPGEMLLGRTFERFRIPEGYAGKLEGRSSYARMGLSVHCSADFINPGYPGRMPLELVNHSAHTIVLVPKIHICQLIVIKLSSSSEKVYGDRELESKYINDDGGPSYWWRDKRIKKLHQAMGGRNVQEEIQVRILNQIGQMEPEVIERFEEFVQKVPQSRLNNSAELLEQFSEDEEKNRKLTWLFGKLKYGVGLFLLSIAIGASFTKEFGFLHYVIWTLALIGVAISLNYHFRGDPPKSFLGKKELRELVANETSGQ